MPDFKYNPGEKYTPNVEGGESASYRMSAETRHRISYLLSSFPTPQSLDEFIKEHKDMKKKLEVFERMELELEIMIENRKVRAGVMKSINNIAKTMIAVITVIVLLRTELASWIRRIVSGEG